MFKKAVIWGGGSSQILRLKMWMQLGRMIIIFHFLMKNYKSHHSSVSPPSLICSTETVDGSKESAHFDVFSYSYLLSRFVKKKKKGDTIFNLMTNTNLYNTVDNHFPCDRNSRGYSWIGYLEWLLSLLVRIFDTTWRQDWNPRLFFLFFCPRQEWGWCFFRSQPKGRTAETCKDGRATNVVRGRNSSWQKCTGGELPKSYKSRGLLREQLCPGE